MVGISTGMNLLQGSNTDIKEGLKFWFEMDSLPIINKVNSSQWINTPLANTLDLTISASNPVSTGLGSNVLLQQNSSAPTTTQRNDFNWPTSPIYGSPYDSTISFWIRSYSNMLLPYFSIFNGATSPLAISIDNVGSPSVRLHVGGVVVEDTIKLSLTLPSYNVWYNVTYVLNVQSMDAFYVYYRITGYINGALSLIESSGTYSNSRSFTYIFKNAFEVAAAPLETYYTPKVLVDNLCYWTRALSQSEINTLYNSGSGISYSQLV